MMHFDLLSSAFLPEFLMYYLHNPHSGMEAPACSSSFLHLRFLPLQYQYYSVNRAYRQTLRLPR